MKILGISSYYHDSAAVLIDNGEIIAAAQEERFTRIKHDPSFPSQAISYCLKQGECSLHELDAIVFYDKPFLKFERILQTVLETAPKGLALFLKSMPIWLKEKLLLKSDLRKKLNELAKKKVTVPILFSSHHLSHAASSFYTSPFQEAAILTIDGVGEWATASISKGNRSLIENIEELHFPHSLGLLYAAFTSFLGFKVNEGEYKVMGLAPYADPSSEDAEKYYNTIVNELVTVFDDGSLKLNLPYFSYMHAERMIPVKKWEKLFQFSARKPDEPLTKAHASLAFALQKVTEEIVFKMARHAKELTGSDSLCLAGGVALNCVSNGKLMASGLFKNIYVQPASGDAGGALGAALVCYHMHFKKNREPKENPMKHGALGVSFSEEEIYQILEKSTLAYCRLDEEQLLDEVSGYLAQGKVVGWFQGRMEFGPRALGYRSILGDARNPDMQRILNLKIKKRESFRPFAPILLEEELSTYFENAKPNEFMLFVYPIKKGLQNPRPETYYTLPFAEMLKEAGSILPAITHIDYSARIQTIAPQADSKIRKLLENFKKQTGVGVLINTSFNVKDEPIVCTPEDAIRCFLQTEMDILVLENYILKKDGIS